MSNYIATTKLSSKGQVVIPEEIREKMGLHSGDQFIVFANNDYVMFKMIMKPSKYALQAMRAKIRKSVKAAGITRADLASAIKEARKK